jgi:hypothetical protein
MLFIIANTRISLRTTELGVVHIHEREMAITDEIREKYQYIDRVEKVIRFLKKNRRG